MKITLKRTLATVASSALLTITTINSAIAFVFDQVDIDQSAVIPIAQPRKDGNYQLLVIEQIPGQRQCWAESGSNPTQVTPLLLNFNFTNDCKRATDSNGFSIRIAGEDLGLKYLLSLQKINGDILLVGSPTDTSLKPIIVGRTNGIINDFLRIRLEPGWRFTKRAYQGQTLGHYYFTRDQPVTGGGIATQPSPSPSPSPSTSSGFRDITNNIYASEIKEAVSLGFVAGFSEDNTFRPQDPLTREQLVSIVIEALKRIPGTQINLPTLVSTFPYQDVDAKRWSAAKIQFARDKKIVSGYADGRFQPNKPVTRAELVTVLRRAAEYALAAQGKSSTLTAKNAVFPFVDTQGHWADQTINIMSAYCKVASPYNETGNRFLPNDPARRDYSTAATLRMFKCVKN
jgi:N-acetylmuramoyl-L-alanine amidase